MDEEWPEDWESDNDENLATNQTFSSLRKWQDEEFEVALKFEQAKKQKLAQKKQEITHEALKKQETKMQEACPTTLIPVLLMTDGLSLRFRLSHNNKMNIYEWVFHKLERNETVIAKIKFEIKLNQNIKLFFNGKELLPNETLTQSAILNRTTINCELQK